MSSREIIEAVKVAYPKFSKTALSLGSRSYDTGVMFTPKAAGIIEAVQGHQRPQEGRREFRRKSIDFHCRLSPEDARRVKREMARREIDSAQDLLEGLLLQWAGISEKEPSPMDQIGNGPEGEADARPASPPMVTQNDKGGQHETE